MENFTNENRDRFNGIRPGDIVTPLSNDGFGVVKKLNTNDTTYETVQVLWFDGFLMDSTARSAFLKIKVKVESYQTF